MEEKTITVNKGEVVLKKPTAGVRNKALIEAEIVGNGKVIQSAFITNLVPHCIKSHPFGTVPISQALDSLSMEEYDKISKAVSELLSGNKDLAKN